MKMKYLISSVVVVLAALFFSSCGKSTPGEAYKAYTEQLKAKNYEGFVDGYDFSGIADTAKVKSTQQALVGVLRLSESEVDKKGGIKSVEIIEETVNPGDTTAMVKARLTYGDGSTNDGNTEMVLRDGQWKMKLNK